MKSTFNIYRAIKFFFGIIASDIFLLTANEHTHTRTTHIISDVSSAASLNVNVLYLFSLSLFTFFLLINQIVHLFNTLLLRGPVFYFASCQYIRYTKVTGAPIRLFRFLFYILYSILIRQCHKFVCDEKRTR